MQETNTATSATEADNGEIPEVESTAKAGTNAGRFVNTMKENTTKFPIHRAYYPYRNIDPTEMEPHQVKPEDIAHRHTCCVCHQDFHCIAEDCAIENRYAVCDEQSCQTVWEFEGSPGEDS